MGSKVSDWLNLNSLTTPAVIAALNDFVPYDPRKDTYRTTHHTVETKWDINPQKIVLDSLAWCFQHLSVCELFSHHVQWVNSPHEVPISGPVTLHAADKITVLCCYRNSPADLLALAHEFGHALQLVKLNGRFCPPVDREVAAFLGEHILLDYAKANQPAMYLSLASVWQEETNTYLGYDAKALMTALCNLDGPYTYRHNYPVARLIAAKVFASSDRELIWSVFNGASAIDWFFKEYANVGEFAA